MKTPNIYKWTEDGELIKKINSHPKVKDFYIGEQDGLFSFTFKDLKYKNSEIIVVATPFFEIDNDEVSTWKERFDKKYKETDIILFVDDENTDDELVYNYVSNSKTSFKNQKEFIDWYYGLVDEIYNKAESATVKYKDGGEIKDGKKAFEVLFPNL